MVALFLPYLDEASVTRGGAVEGFKKWIDFFLPFWKLNFLSGIIPVTIQENAIE